jgi:hypothetical protein
MHISPEMNMSGTYRLMTARLIEFFQERKGIRGIEKGWMLSDGSMVEDIKGRSKES